MPGLRRTIVDDYFKTMGEKELGSTLFDLEVSLLPRSSRHLVWLLLMLKSVIF